MNTIKFNNVEMRVESYNKTTYLSGDTIISNANCNVITNNMTALNDLMTTPIETIQIYHDSTLIYDLDDIDARVNNISEYLSDDHMNVNVSLTFMTDEEAEPAANEGV